MTISIRVLDPRDVVELRALRLQALRESPDAFLSSYEEDALLTESEHAARLTSTDPAVSVLGAFAAGRLIGMVGFYRDRHRKAQHKAGIWGMYVEPGGRRLGAGRLLLDAAIEHLRRAPGIEQIYLSVSVTQPVARALYVSRGFVSVGIERHAMKDGDRYIDEEAMVLFLAGAERLRQAEHGERTGHG